MLDIRRIREDFENVKAKVASRGNGDYDIEQVVVLDNERREILVKVEKKKNEQKTDSKQIPILKKKRRQRRCAYGGNEGSRGRHQGHGRARVHH